MPDLTLSPYDYLFYLLAFFVFTFLIQQIYYWFFFARLAFYKVPSLQPCEKGISVVICARNEYENLKNNLPLILDQDHPDFEVVVVNWASDDESSVLLDQMSSQYPQLKIVEIRENLNFFTGKKFPLSIGIKSAKNEIIVVTEPGCRPVSRKWLSAMGSGFSGSTEIVLGYGGFEKRKGLLNTLIRFDTYHIACRYLSSALAGVPYMGIGRNMAYLRSLFIRNKGFISHYRVHSGEDDLFINQVAGKTNTRVVLNPESFMVSGQNQTFRNWMTGKRNISRTTRLYRTRHRVLSGAYSLSVFLFYLLFVVLIVLNYNPVLVLPLFLLRLIIQVILFYRCMNRMDQKDLIWFVPLYEIALIVIDTFASASSRFTRSNRWK